MTKANLATRSILVAVSLTAITAPVFAQNECKSTEAVSYLGKSFSPNVTLTPGDPNRLIEHGIPQFDASSIMLSVRLSGVVRDTDWSLVFRDSALRVLASFGAQDLRQSKGAWSGRLRGSSVRAELLANRGSDVAVEIFDGLALPAESSETRLFSAKAQQPDWRPLYSSPDETPRRAGNSVAFLTSASPNPRGGPKVSWCCSGVVVGSDLLLTNWHCGGFPGLSPAKYWGEEVCHSTQIDVSWDDGPQRREYYCKEVVSQDIRLDYALLRLEPTIGAGRAPGQPIRARLANALPNRGDPVFLVHHAKCSPKLLSSQCAVLSPNYPSWVDPDNSEQGAVANGPEMTHDCDSDPGASGAALFDATGRLLGIHHAGFDRDQKCSVAAGGRTNKAVRIGEILKHIAASKPELAETVAGTW